MGGNKLAQVMVAVPPVVAGMSDEEGKPHDIALHCLHKGYRKKQKHTILTKRFSEVLSQWAGCQLYGFMLFYTYTL